MTDYKGIGFSWEYVFAITEKGNYYKIYSKSVEILPAEKYRAISTCFYGDKKAWLYRDEKEYTESETPYIDIMGIELENYLNGACSNDLRIVLDCYMLDSEINRFLMVSNYDAESIPGAARLFVTMITSDGPTDFIPTEERDVDIALFQDLNLQSDNVHYIAGLCVAHAKQYIHLIDCDVLYWNLGGQYSPQRGLFDVEWYKRIVEFSSSYQIKERAESGDAFAIIPQVGVLFWEYADDAKCKLKEEPNFCYVDLNDEKNLCNGTIGNLLLPSTEQDAQPVAKFEQLTIPDDKNDDLIPF